VFTKIARGTTAWGEREIDDGNRATLLRMGGVNRTRAHVRAET
jgi:hypothetical protein